MKPKKSTSNSKGPFSVLFLIMAFLSFIFLSSIGTPVIISLLFCLLIGYFLAFFVQEILGNIFGNLRSTKNTAESVLSGDDVGSEFGKDVASFALSFGSIIYIIVCIILILIIFSKTEIGGIVAFFAAYILYDFLFVKPKKLMHQSSQTHTIEKIMAERFENASFSPEGGVDMEPVKALGLYPDWNDTAADHLLTETRNGKTYEVSSLLATYHYITKERGTQEDGPTYVDVHHYENRFEGCVIHKIGKNPSVTVPLILMPKSMPAACTVPENAVMMPEQDENYDIFGLGSLPDIYEVQAQLRILQNLRHLTGTIVAACIFPDDSYYMPQGRKFLDIESEKLSNVEIANMTRDELELVDAGLKLIG